MAPSELRMIADHMGRSVNIHTDVYRLQSSVLERRKVARILLAAENGTLNRFQGRSLASIGIDDLPVPVDYQDMWKNDSEVDENDSRIEPVEDEAVAAGDATHEPPRKNR